MDNHADVLRGSDYGKVIEPGSPAASKLIKAVKHMAGAEPMPKKSAALKPEEIALLEKWITLGVPWPEEKVVAKSGKTNWQDHWAFQKIVKPAVPQKTTASHNPVDAFVLTKLTAAGLKPAPQADAATLCRRLYLTLTGLLPSYEQMEAFKHASARNASSAESELVDQLLSSPHYGERWARYWLDLARYSDTEGYQVAGKDIRYPYAYTYRDWVVNSLNADMPYDQFVTFQLAADKVMASQPAGIPHEEKNLAALGFLTVGDTFIGNKDLQTDDRIDVTARGLLGLTVGCARCHDHKYDPIPAKDYYSMYSIFNSSIVPEDLPVIGKPASETAYASFQGEVAKVETKMADFRKVIYEDVRNPERLTGYLSFLYEAQNKSLENEAFRGRCGQLHLRDRVASRWRTFIREYANKGVAEPVLLAWKQFATLPEAEFAAKAPAIVADLQKPGTKCLPEIAEAFKSKPAPAKFDDVASIYSEVFLKHLNPLGAKDEINAFLMRDTSPLALKVDDMDQFFTRQDMETTVRMKNEMKAIEIANAGAPPRAMVMIDRPKPADMHVFIRGNPGRPGELAPRGNLTLLGGQKFTDGSGRLELAQAITSRDNPLTARVIV
ncbi:MAG: Planctomycete cytochrome, partial [Verrucomicrobiaceae bacterium]|nr:Planctomycete cytochrome [Verrucomicrobiaceae bacterium]